MNKTGFSLGHKRAEIMHKATIVLWISIHVFTSIVLGYSGGRGTEGDPYQIATAQDLIDLGNEPNDYDKHFILTADIDLSGRTFDRAVIAPDVNDAELKHQGPKFNGSFTGQGHIIHNLRIQGKDFCALFGETGRRAEILSLGLGGIDILGNSRVSGIVGVNGGAITSSYSSGTVNGGFFVGGLTGSNGGHITASYSTGTVIGERFVGGLAGSSSGHITTSYCTASIRGEDIVGGLVGGEGSPPGTGPIINCFWDTQSSGLSGSDGGVGLTTQEMKDPEMLGLNGLARDPNWVLDAYRDYPRLSWEGGPGLEIPTPVVDWLDGAGTARDPYLIGQVAQLQRLSKAGLLMDRHFCLSNDLDLAGITWPQAPLPYFNGSFDGCGYRIRNLSIDGSGHLGLFGYADRNAKIMRVDLVYARIRGVDKYIGILVGENHGDIFSCKSTGSVSGKQNVGGLVGESEDGSITLSYSTASVSGLSQVGGLVGINWVRSRITLCYSAGSVSGSLYVGGLVRTNSILGSVINCFWDTQSSGLSVSDGGMGLTTQQMRDRNTYLNAGWDLVGETENGTSDIWQVRPNSYPILSALSGNIPNPPTGVGTADDPYRISNAYGLGSVWHRPRAYYCLEADIDLSGITWNKAVIPWFSGRFDGNGFSIYALHIEGEENLGLFGFLSSQSEISRVGLEGVDINGVDLYVGGLVGENQGHVMESYSTGLVSGDTSIGGLVGWNQGYIVESFSTSTVSGDSNIGGLLGIQIYGSITSSYSSGSIRGERYVGGLVGSNGYSSITSSYSTSSVSGVNDVGGLVGVGSSDEVYASFWDTETSGQSESAGGTGLPTLTMWDINTYLGRWLGLCRRSGQRSQ